MWGRALVGSHTASMSKKTASGRRRAAKACAPVWSAPGMNQVASTNMGSRSASACTALMDTGSIMHPS